MVLYIDEIVHKGKGTKWSSFIKIKDRCSFYVVFFFVQRFFKIVLIYIAWNSYKFWLCIMEIRSIFSNIFSLLANRLYEKDNYLQKSFKNFEIFFCLIDRILTDEPLKKTIVLNISNILIMFRSRKTSKL